eukprot:gnl/TRDRNA2_/TRDRNA2_50398_c0_seq1.p1 gnl/TRDRNA2_/TRDRNA2_50398_c0~~gnl/TRDRNA2_/TRDRNA2_50398_c0_seq1.p1  ORF type:complete len:516 (+),score=60.21 gnl/TRDRNA2_/TRDRNA2_50398_c0_seq1:225-1550(+)
MAPARAAPYMSKARARLPVRDAVSLHVTPKRTMPLASAATSAVTVPHAPDVEKQFEVLPMLSGLNGKAMQVEMSDIPTKGEVRKALPKHVFERDTMRSLKYAAGSVAQAAACVALGTLIPLKLAALPLWAAYAAVTGTVWTGMWVIAHECGHGAFSNNLFIQDTVGYILHSALLVPYFSWQRSHAVHHANTNHITKGETHVPSVLNGREGIERPRGEKRLGMAKTFGEHIYPVVHAGFKLLLGWPAYLVSGVSGGPKYGESNHFMPSNRVLWPGRLGQKAWQSDFGIVGMLGLLGACAFQFGLAKVAALYVLPLLVTNAWLVGYTWLQHTDVDVPHLSGDEFSYMRGAFLTIDRPYGGVIDYLHHRIGSTHVAHHIDCTIPHYHAKEATDAIAKAFPKAYLYDPTPIHKALWRVATNCTAVKLRPDDGRYTWVPAFEKAGA